MLHAPPAKAAFAEFRIDALRDWPPYSPDLNPEEHVWAWVLEQLRKPAHQTSSFTAFKAKVVRSVKAFPGSAKLVGSLTARLEQCVARKGAMTQF